MPPKTVCIMQPTYLPWIGYFDLMDQSDPFIFLDSVQFEKRSWQQRNRIKTPQGELMLTIPVSTKGKRDQAIEEVRIDTATNFQEKHCKAIQRNYAKAPHFNRYFPALEKILMEKALQLRELNVGIVRWLAECFGIRPKTLLSSELAPAGKRAALLIDLCQKVGADRYLSPAGSRSYLDGDEGFKNKGIELVFHQYEHPRYSQLHGEFIPYLSALDLLFNEGGKSLGVIRSGRILQNAPLG